MLRRRLLEILTQAIQGDDSSAAMTCAERRRWYRRSILSRFHANEDGKISFVSIFTVLTFIVIIVLVTNTGITVNDKIQLQNAADATAYSSALWQARSLNAITTTNHLMGELTAVTVILDSFGGTMLGQDTSFRSDESKNHYDRVREESGQYIRANKGTFAPFLHNADRNIVDFVVGSNGLLTRDKGEHYAGAAIYDAKLTLQFWAWFALTIKHQCNIGLEIADKLEKTPFAAFGYAIEAVSVTVHVGMTLYLSRMGIEWVHLEATETAIGILNRGQVRQLIRGAVIPTLSIYADTVVGSQIARKLGASQTSFNASVRETQEKLAESHRLTSAQTFPGWQELQLPVTEEQPPLTQEVTNANGPTGLGEWNYPGNEWTGDYTDPDLENIQAVYEKLRKEVDKVRDFLEPLAKAAEALEDASNFLSGTVDVPNDLKMASQAFNDIKPLISMLTKGLPKPPDARGLPGNPCISDNLHPKYRLPKFYWSVEKRSQWVRATYPYVDEYRAPVITYFRKNCRLSNAATYYVNWSNRYTLANSFEFRKHDKDNADQTSEEQKLRAELRKRVRDLRADFDAATDDTDQENAGTVTLGKFDKISSDLLEAIQKYKGRIASLEKWFEDVTNHPQLVQQLRQGVDIPPGTTIPKETLRGLAEEMALVNVLDELLSLLEELLDSLELKEPHMYVLRGMQPDAKGLDEPWLTNDALAEELFCITAYVSRRPPTILGSIIFKHGNSDERNAFASAMVYNANGREMAANPGSTQPNTGWDTLNWEPPVRAAEWGNHKPSERSDISPWQLISPRDLSAANRVKLNWQVKLVPLTERRLREIGKHDSNLAPVGEHHELITH